MEQHLRPAADGVMSILSRYVSRVFLAHVVLVLFGFVALVQLLDLLNSADRIIKHHGDSPLALLRYAGLRLPELVSFLLPFSVLIASLLALARLAQHNEVLAMKSMGMSYYKLLVRFAPAAFSVALLHLAFADQIAPSASRALADWYAASTKLREPQDAADQSASGLWMRSGLTVVRVGAVLDKGSQLRGVTLFVRDKDGNLVGRITADRALHSDGAWRLLNVERLSLADRPGGELVRTAEMPWETDLTPKHLHVLTTPPGSLSIRELLAFLSDAGLGNHPDYWYKTWLHKRIAVPVASFLMILLAAPVAQGMQRHGGMGAGIAVGVALGFLYFVVDGLGLALGEAGAIPPALAAWTAPLLFASIGVTTLFSIER